jgi:putative restriction endonuclease
MEFSFQGQQLNIVEMPGGRGIRKPAGWKTALSVRTTLGGTYEDVISPAGRVLYSYQSNREGSAHNPYNNALREVMRRQIPILHLWETERGYYLPSWPCFVVADDEDRQRVEIELSPVPRPLPTSKDVAAEPLAREYRLISQRQRVHQAKFRDRVLNAYEERCSICVLKRRGLLDAAHITPDASEEGLPVVSNGLSLCKIHHSAYDQAVLGIRPDYVVEVNPEVLDEIDGPMLRHGLQEFHGSRLHVPPSTTDRPDPDRLEARYQEFRALS